ncbi:hypothetical protein JMY91_14455 [Brenneria goodwinii]|nr:hypothetical protein [Brenneria goodwinii]
MAVTSAPVTVPPTLKKHPDIADVHALGRSRGGYATKIHLAAVSGFFSKDYVIEGHSPSHQTQSGQRGMECHRWFYWCQKYCHDGKC